MAIREVRVGAVPPTCAGGWGRGSPQALPLPPFGALRRGTPIRRELVCGTFLSAAGCAATTAPMDDSLTAHDLGSFLLEAAAHGTEEHMAFFLDRVGRADELLVADSRGKTPLHLALARSNVAAARQILRTPHARLKYDFECRLQYLREKRALLHQSGSAAEAEAYAAFAARERKKLAFGCVRASVGENGRGGGD